MPHLAPSYVADTIRAHFPTLGITGEAKVAAICARFDPSIILPFPLLGASARPFLCETMMPVGKLARRQLDHGHASE